MKTDSNHNKTLRLKPHYIFGTVALATLLGLLAAMHPRGNQFIAESLVTIEPGVATEGDLAARDQLLRDKCVAPETVEVALAKVPPNLVKDAGLHELAENDLIQQIGRRVAVEIERPSGSQNETVHVQFASQSQPFAIRLVEAIGEFLVENYTERETNPQYVRDLANADQQIETLKGQLADLRNAQTELLERGVAAWRKANPADPPPELDKQAQDRQHEQPADLSREQPLTITDDDDFVSTVELADDDNPEGVTTNDEVTEETPFPEVFADADEWNPEWSLTSDENDTPAGDRPQPTAGGSDSPAVPVDRGALPPAYTPPKVTQPQRPSGFVADPPSAQLPQVHELNPRWSAISSALSRAQMELERALQSMTPEHPTIVDMRERIKKLERILAKTPQYLPADIGQPNATLGPAPSSDEQKSPSASSEGAKLLGIVRFDSTEGEIRTVGFNESEARQRVANSPEFRALTTRIRAAKTELAKAINKRNALTATSTQHELKAGEARLIDSKCPSVLPFDLLTLFLPAGMLALIAAFARKPAEAPAVLCSVSDARKALRATVIGTISTKNGPGIPAAELGGPPAVVRWLVCLSEVVCVAAAVLVLISIVQIPGYTKQFLVNPFSAFVTSFDFVVQFIRHT